MIFEYANRTALLPTKCGLLIVKRINEKKKRKKTGISFEANLDEGLCDKDKGNVLYLCVGSEE